MKRRWPREIPWAQDGAKGRPKYEIIHRWVSAAKRRTHKRERREGKHSARHREED